ncbi:hypothetical protein [Prochlorococcus sp. MIT 1307]|uniref:hypothetical protein n=1 Tax=Prochlorococcus sp. MIT 1307 TaxID=3096219 RepID=UPI002A74FDDF|nr:hypothetical protein [Prochlorococcus sp. MIT 1307]
MANLIEVKLTCSLFPFRRLSGTVVFLIVLLALAFSFVSPVTATSEFLDESEGLNALSLNKLQEVEPLKGQLREVSPPKAVQKIRSRLAHYKPQLRIEYPPEGEIMRKEINDKWSLVLNVKNWPLVEDPEVGLGPHVVVQVDDLEPLRISKAEGERVVVPMDGLSPGSHRLVAYLSYPWGEALKAPETNIESRIHFFKELPGTQPDTGEPWITIASPSSLSFDEPLLIDSLIWNAPLQGLTEGDDQWRLRISVNGQAILMDSLESIWIKGISSDISDIQFELLDLQGNPINPIFNNKLRIISTSQLEKPLWMLSDLSEKQIARFVGEFESTDLMPLSQEKLITPIQSNGISSVAETDDPSIVDYELLFPK